MQQTAKPAKSVESHKANPAPEWFHGGERAWRNCHAAFDAGSALDKTGAQHAMAGLALCLAAAVVCAIEQRAGQSQALGWALGLAGMSAAAWGQNLRQKAWPAMREALAQAIARSGHPGLRPQAQETERQEAQALAQKSRAQSARGSFGELASGVAEGRSARRKIIAPISWLGGIAFRGLGGSVDSSPGEAP